MRTKRSHAPYPRLLGDLGGTEHRFGWVASPAAEVTNVESCPGSGDLGAEIKRYLAAQKLAAPASASLGIAAPVFGDDIAMTNGAVRFSIRDLEHELGVETLLVMNDFAALAHALPSLHEDESWPVGRGEASAGGTLALVGPGTGLGVSGLLALPGGHVPVVGEGGHSTLAAANDHEADVIAALRLRFGHVSAERVLSGPGIVNLYTALCLLSGSPAEALGASEITQRGLDGSDDRCRETLDMFFAFLGSVAGDLALTLGARGGVFIGGGIVARLGKAIERSGFRERFEAKGRYQDYLAGISTRVIADASGLALRGANAALED